MHAFFHFPSELWVQKPLVYAQMVSFLRDEQPSTKLKVVMGCSSEESVQEAGRGRIIVLSMHRKGMCPEEPLDLCLKISDSIHSLSFILPCDLSILLNPPEPQFIFFHFLLNFWG